MNFSHQAPKAFDQPVYVTRPVLPPLALLAARAWESRWGGRARAGWAFAGVCAVNIVLAVAASELAGRSTLKQSSQDVAAALDSGMNAHLAKPVSFIKLRELIAAVTQS